MSLLLSLLPAFGDDFLAELSMTRHVFPDEGLRATDGSLGRRDHEAVIGQSNDHSVPGTQTDRLAKLGGDDNAPTGA